MRLKFSFYSLTSYQPYNTRTTMERNRPRTKPTPTTNKKQIFAMVFFIASFLYASYTTSYDKHMKYCMSIEGNNFNLCESLF